MSPVPAVVVLHIAGAWWRDQYSDQTQLDIGTIPLIGIIIWHLSKHRIIAGHMQGFYTTGNTELNTSMFTIFQKYCLLWVNFVQMGHSVYNNTEHFSRSQVENLSIKGQKSISYHIESSI